MAIPQPPATATPTTKMFPDETGLVKASASVAPKLAQGPLGKLQPLLFCWTRLEAARTGDGAESRRIAKLMATSPNATDRLIKPQPDFQ